MSKSISIQLIKIKYQLIHLKQKPKECEKYHIININNMFFMVHSAPNNAHIPYSD